MIKKYEISSFSADSLFKLADCFAEKDGTCFLYSGGKSDAAESSYLALFPFESIQVSNRTLLHQEGIHRRQFSCENPWDGLQSHFFDQLSQEGSIAFGWFGYDMGAQTDSDRLFSYRQNPLPDAYWQKSAVIIAFNHVSQTASVSINLAAKEKLDEAAAHLIDLFSTEQGIQQISQEYLLPISETVKETTLPYDSQHCGEHVDKILEIQELIREGEIYQVNFSREFHYQSNKRPFNIFKQIAKENSAPFFAYFCYDQTAIVSSSPERFLQKRGDRLETRPIKGTIRRGKTAEEDQALKEQLLSSEKERAELLMITDLMRNDLGKVSVAGSVDTLDIWRCEEYTNVFHLISVIQSRAKKNLKPLEIIRDCFPGGSITGCPKRRAMEVIDKLENRARGIYTGSIGYITSHGDFDLNIAIRTLVAKKGEFSLQLGGGIVIDSNPEQEYLEILYKGNSFFKILQKED